MKTVFLFLALSFSLVAQSQVSTQPTFFDDSEPLVINFDANQGNKALYNHSEQVYVHIGVITNRSTGGTDWKYASPWGNNADKYKASRTGQNSYQLKIPNSLRSFFRVADGEKIKSIAILFRSADGSKVARTAAGGDMFLKLAAPGVNMLVEKLETRNIFLPEATTQNFVAQAKGHTQLSLTVNGTQVATTSEGRLEHNHNFSSGIYQVEFTATDGTKTLRQQYSFVVAATSPEASLPAGLKDGINLNPTQNKATLVLHAYGQEQVFVIGSFNNWTVSQAYQMKKAANGRFWLELENLDPNTEYLFQYVAGGKLLLADPYSQVIYSQDDRYIPASTYPNMPQYPGEYTTGNVSAFKLNTKPYQWQVANFKSPKKDKLIIYELLLRDFTNDAKGGIGNYKLAIEKLDYLQGLGINAIELMPTSEFEGNDSWGYNPSFYFAVDKAYGSPEDLKRFIDECHKRGISVFGDMVLNHAFGQNPFVQMAFDKYGSDQILTKTGNPWFNPKSPNDTYKWGADFNHEAPETQKFVDRVNRYWLEEFKFDGFRFDFTKGFTNKKGDGQAYDGTRIKILKRMYDAIQNYKPSATLIIEHLADNAEERVLAEHGYLLWANNNHAYAEAAMGYAANLEEVLYTRQGFTTKSLINYAESHDEERILFKTKKYGNNKGDYNTKELDTRLERSALVHHFLIPLPGPKMIWQFGELGYDISIDQNGRVGRKPLFWKEEAKPNHKALYHKIAFLNKLKTSHNLFTDKLKHYKLHQEMKHLYYESDDTAVAILGNFGVEAQEMEVQLKEGELFVDVYTGKRFHTVDGKLHLTLQAGEYLILSNQKLQGAKHFPDVMTNIKEDAEVPAEAALRVQNIPLGIRLETTNPDQNRNLLRVYKPTGQLVHQSSLPNGTKELNLPQPGVYILHWQNGNTRTVKKLLVY